jgi:chromate transport protein ChrA
VTAGGVAAAVIAVVFAAALGAAWAQCRRAWRDHRAAVATMRATWRAAWWHTWALVRIGVIAAVIGMIIVTVWRT